MGALILLYHRVNNLLIDPQELSVTPENFELQLQFLKSQFKILSLKELLERRDNGLDIDGTIALTFDDGYADNYYNALPILEKNKVQATIFVTSGHVENSREFWWDELERIFIINLKKGRLKLKINKKSYQWNITSKVDSQEVYKELSKLIKSLDTIDREKILSQLFIWSNLNRQEGRVNNRAVTKNELKNLSESKFIDIQSHCVNHCVLSVEKTLTIFDEYSESKHFLETITQKTIDIISYPFGTKFDYNRDSIRLAKKVGYKYGIANNQGILDASSLNYEIPRFLVRDWDLSLFKSQIYSMLAQGSENKLFPESNPLESIGILFENLKKHTSDQPEKIKNTKTQVLAFNTQDKVGGAAKIADQINNYFSSSMFVGLKNSYNENVFTIPKNHDSSSKKLKKFAFLTGWKDLFHNEIFSIINTNQFKNSELIHCHNLHGDYFSPLWLPLLSKNKPLIWTLHDMQSITGYCAHSLSCKKWKTGCGQCPDLTLYPYVEQDFTEMLWRIKKMCFEVSNITIVVPSKWLKYKVEQSILKNHNIKLIYNGVNHLVFKPRDKVLLRHELGLPQNKKILLFVADGSTRNQYKGGSFLGKVNTVVKNNNAIFLTIGSRSKFENKITNSIDIPYIYDEVLLSKYYAAVDLLVYPTLADNFPLVVLEALSSGTPVITFNTGGINEVVTHLENGYLAKYNDLEDLIKGLQLMLSDKKLLSRNSQKSREIIEKYFTLDQMMNNYKLLYENSLNTFEPKCNELKIKDSFDVISKLLQQNYQPAISGIIWNLSLKNDLLVKEIGVLKLSLLYRVSNKFRNKLMRFKNILSFN